MQAGAILLASEKFTRAYLFQIAHKIMWLANSIIRCSMNCAYQQLLISITYHCHVSEIKTQGNFPLCKGIYLKLFGSTGCTEPFQSHA